MAFNQDNFASVGANSADAPAVYSYSTDDTLATVGGALYFNDKVFQLESGDVILVNATDGFAIFTSDGAGAASVSVEGGSLTSYASGEVIIDGGAPTLVAGTNVASLDDLGTGYVRVNFTDDLPNTNYVLVGTARSNTTSATGLVLYQTGTARSVSSMEVRTSTTAGAAFDAAFSFMVLPA